MAKGVVIQVVPGRRPELLEVEFPLSLSQLQSFVGGYLELVSLGHGCHAYVNEDGERLGLAPNVVGDQLLRALLQGTGRALHPRVVLGPVLVLGREGSEDAPVPEGVVRVVRQAMGLTDWITGAKPAE